MSVKSPYKLVHCSITMLNKTLTCEDRNTKEIILEIIKGEEICEEPRHY